MNFVVDPMAGKQCIHAWDVSEAFPVGAGGMTRTSDGEVLPASFKSNLDYLANYLNYKAMLSTPFVRRRVCHTGGFRIGSDGIKAQKSPT